MKVNSRRRHYTEPTGWPGRSPVILDSYTYTDHARLRMAQRGISVEDVRNVLRFGSLNYSGTAVIYFLGKDDIPDNDLRRQQRLEGTGVVTSLEGAVITVWRNRRRGARNIRIKQEAMRCGLPSLYAQARATHTVSFRDM
jgi:hypothetical protein